MYLVLLSALGPHGRALNQLGRPSLGPCHVHCYAVPNKTNTIAASGHTQSDIVCVPGSDIE